jgi:acetylornithine deacetylase/succinyl-diaminopimelate desuccinylase-like protein
VRRLADEGFRPKADLVFWAVPDEECGGVQGAMTTLCNNHASSEPTNALTEVGGTVRRGSEGLVVDASVADKGPLPCQITVRGRQAHASLAYGAANPLVKAAEVIRRLTEWQPAVRAHDTWRQWVLAQGLRPRPGRGTGRSAPPGRCHRAGCAVQGPSPTASGSSAKH